MSILSDPALAAELRRHYLFSGLDDDQFSRVLEGSQSFRVLPDECLFEQGQPAERFFLVRRGLMKLSRLSPAGEEKVIELVHSGQSFAEALMFAGKIVPYPVTARAIESSEVLGFDNRSFIARLKDSPDTCLRMLGGMSRRLHSLVDEIDRLALQSATSRLADFLLDAAEDGRVELRTAKHVLASRLSIKPETLSRIFARLGSEGVIRVQGSSIELLKPDELRRIVQAAEV